MADYVKIKLRPGAIGEILTSREVEGDMLGRARRIAATAGPGMEASSFVGANRARASVVTATPQAMLAEARDRRLSSALSAGRG